jgi:hypothetical protein
MANPKAKITQAELTRYLKAYRDADIPIGRTEIARDGTVVIITATDTPASTQNDWDSS